MRIIVCAACIFVRQNKRSKIRSSRIVHNISVEISEIKMDAFFRQYLRRIVFCVMLILFYASSEAQNRGMMNNFNGSGFNNPGMGRGSGQSGAFKDTLIHRTGLEDSASILYRYMDEERFYFQDSSVHEFGRRWPIPWNHFFLGNIGSASRSLLFNPILQPGWDHGLHAFDIYHNDARQSRFYNVTRPFSELSYILGSKAEQNIGVFHTQNIRYNWNFSFDYKLINSPGFFKNQKSSHNQYLLNTWFTSRNQRYRLFGVAGLSKTGAGENGGLVSTETISQLPTYSNRVTIPTNLGGNEFESRALLSNVINTGNTYRKRELLISNSYDFGLKDSVKTDTAYQPIFISKWRLQYNFHYQDFDFLFEDKRVDSAVYARVYGLTNVQNGFLIQDKWALRNHEFSVFHFPERNNPGHRIKTTLRYQQIEGNFGTAIIRLNNLSLQGDYRNRTRNGKWDFQLKGNFFLEGDYSGDYNAEINLTRFLGKNRNLLTISLVNVNRTPSFIHNDLSNFKQFNRGNTNFNKENSSVLTARYQIPRLKTDLTFRYFIMSNYVYFSDNRRSVQEATLFNAGMLSASRKFRLNRSWNWYLDLAVQQKTANAPVNLPLIVSRSRIAHERQYFRNLSLSTGIEGRYVSSFYADGYSPLLGQFYLQNDTLIANRPDITAYAHLRIRSWYLFVRAEQLNAVQFAPFGFFRNNFAAPAYPMPGLLLRLGIYWGFIN